MQFNLKWIPSETFSLDSLEISRTVILVAAPLLVKLVYVRMSMLGLFLGKKFQSSLKRAHAYTAY